MLRNPRWELGFFSFCVIRRVFKVCRILTISVVNFKEHIFSDNGDGRVLWLNYLSRRNLHSYTTLYTPLRFVVCLQDFYGLTIPSIFQADSIR